MKAWITMVVTLVSFSVQAKDGFSIGIGLGGGFFSLDRASLSSSLEEVGRPSGEADILTGVLSDGLALRFSLAYTFLEYVSVEMGLTGHGWNLSGDDIGGSGHASLVVHFHPLPLWFSERKVDATVFLGGGYSIVGGGHEGDVVDRGLDGGALECGFSGRYYLMSWLSLGADFRFTVPFYSRWFVDWDSDESYRLQTAPDGLFFALLAMTTFHFQTAGQH